MLLGNRYVVESVANFYRVIAKDLLDAPSVSPRGIETKEIIAPQIVITDPQQRLVYNKERKYNLMHALTESIMLFSNSDYVEHIGEFNKTMKMFSDDGRTMYGSYGKRISFYIPFIIAKLKGDNDTRQATININDRDDILATTKDVPCTNSLQFLIRDSKLNLIVTMRSNDVLYGLQYDVVMFSMLQETIANTLGLEIGFYIHQPGSLHIYKAYKEFDGYDMLESLSQNNESIKLNNTSEFSEWTHLANFFTDLPYDQNKLITGRTAKQIQNLIKAERLYRHSKAEGKNTNNQLFNELYNLAPGWAKPFVTRWQYKPE